MHLPQCCRTIVRPHEQNFTILRKFKLVYRFLVDLEGPEPGVLLNRISSFLSNQVEVHVPNVDFAMTSTGEEELVDWVDGDRVDVLYVSSPLTEFGRTQGYEGEFALLPPWGLGLIGGSILL